MCFIWSPFITITKGTGTASVIASAVAGPELTVCVDVHTAPVVTKGSKEMFEHYQFSIYASHTLQFIFNVNSWQPKCNSNQNCNSRFFTNLKNKVSL